MAMDFLSVDEEILIATDDDSNPTFINGTSTSLPPHSSHQNGREDEEHINVGDDGDEQMGIEPPTGTGGITITTTVSSARPATGTRQTHRLTLGIIILIFVDIIWVASSELTKYIFLEEQFNKPFFSSYVKTSMFLIFLSGFMCWTPWHDQCLLEFGGRHSTHHHAYSLLESENEFNQNQNNPSSSIITHEIIDNNANENSLSPSSFVPVIYDVNSGYETDDSGQHKSVRFSKIAEVRQLSEFEANEALFARLSYQASMQAEQLAKRLGSRMSMTETAQLSLTFCLMWFVAAYSYQLAISNTEAGIVNLLSSSSSLFTLVLAAIFPSNAGDKFTLSKFLAVLLSFGGVMVVTLSDIQLEDKLIPLGAVFSLISALFYASYLVFLRRKVDHEDKLDIMMFFGFVGLFNLVLLWPLFFILNYFNIETFEWPSHKQWVFLILNGFIGTVFSEVLWLWGCFLTSSLIATLAVSLTIPLSMVADVVLKQISYSHLFYWGSIPMVFSFFVVTLLSHYQNWDPVLNFCKTLNRRLYASRLRDLESRYQRLLDTDHSQRESLMDSRFENEELDGEETDEEEINNVETQPNIVIANSDENFRLASSQINAFSTTAELL